MRRLAVSLMVCLALVGCSDWKGRGVVVEKTHSEAYSWTQMTCSGYGAKGVCTVWVPIIHQVPESWGYKVREADGDTHEVSADRSEWDRTRVGEKFDNRETK